MARAKKSSKKASSKKAASSRHEMIDSRTVDFMPAPKLSEAATPASMVSGINFKMVIGLVVLVLAAVFVTNKGLLVAAVVNGRPIFRWDLNKAMMTRFGQQTLESMISEQLISDAAAKSGVVIGQADIDAKVGEITKSLGANVNIDDLLKYQGMTKSDFEAQIRTQLMVEKILGKDVKITEDDVTNYIATNQATLVSTDEASLREEAKQVILSQAISEKLQPWFVSLKEKASIVRFVK